MSIAKFFRQKANALRQWRKWNSKKVGWLRAHAKGMTMYGAVDRQAVESIERFGKPFITSFSTKTLSGKGVKFSTRLSKSENESPIALSLNYALAGGKRKRLAEARLSFEPESVIIEAIQGRNSKEMISRFKGDSGMTWAEFLMQQVEENARKAGMSAVKIKRPERLESYKDPFNEIIYSGERFGAEKEVERIRDAMRALYYGLAKKLGYRKEEEYFVKTL